MNKKIFLFLPALMLLSAQQATAATAPIVNNTRILEDVLWAVAFVFMAMFAKTAAKAMVSSQAIHNAYRILFVAGIFGFGWKSMGVYMRITGAKNPEWFFEVFREGLEMFASYLFLIAFVILFLKLKK